MLSAAITLLSVWTYAHKSANACVHLSYLHKCAFWKELDRKSLLKGDQHYRSTWRGRIKIGIGHITTHAYQSLTFTSSSYIAWVLQRKSSPKSNTATNVRVICLNLIMMCLFVVCARYTFKLMCAEAQGSVKTDTKNKHAYVHVHNLSLHFFLCLSPLTSFSQFPASSKQLELLRRSLSCICQLNCDALIQFEKEEATCCQSTRGRRKQRSKTWCMFFAQPTQHGHPPHSHLPTQHSQNNKLRKASDWRKKETDTQNKATWGT